MSAGTWPLCPAPGSSAPASIVWTAARHRAPPFGSFPPNRTTGQRGWPHEAFFEQSGFAGAVPVSDNANLKQHLNTPFEQGQTLRDSVEKALRNYFAHLEGADVTDVYNLVLTEVEAPLLETEMYYVKGNQTKASELLGLNRGTLRKKLKQYDML